MNILVSPGTLIANQTGDTVNSLGVRSRWHDPGLLCMTTRKGTCLKHLMAYLAPSASTTPHPTAEPVTQTQVEDGVLLVTLDSNACWLCFAPHFLPCSPHAQHGVNTISHVHKSLACRKLIFLQTLEFL